TRTAVALRPVSAATQSSRWMPSKASWPRVQPAPGAGSSDRGGGWLFEVEGISPRRRLAAHFQGEPGLVRLPEPLRDQPARRGVQVLRVARLRAQDGDLVPAGRRPRVGVGKDLVTPVGLDVAAGLVLAGVALA